MTLPRFSGHFEIRSKGSRSDHGKEENTLGSHKVVGVREATEAAGASILYLPPYSPDLNSIEQVFSKLKTLLRKTAARTVDALWTAIGKLLDAFSPQECSNYLANSGYSIAPT